MDQADAHTFKAVFDRLPGNEWYFSYTYPKRLLFPTNAEKDHNLLVLATVTILTALTAAAALFWRKTLLFGIGAIVIMLFTWYYITKMGGYPFNAILVGLTDLLVAAMLIVCLLKVRKRNVRTMAIKKTPKKLKF